MIALLAFWQRADAVRRCSMTATAQANARRCGNSILASCGPLARQLEVELSDKLDAPVRLSFDLYNVDLAGRAQAFQKLVAGGVAVDEALVTAGLLGADRDN